MTTHANPFPSSRNDDHIISSIHIEHRRSSSGVRSPDALDIEVSDERCYCINHGKGEVGTRDDLKKSSSKHL